MFQLLFDRRHNVLMTRYFGTYVPSDITLRDKAVARIVQKQGLARGIIDFSAVEAIDVPIESLVERAHALPLLPGQQRVIVAPDEVSYSVNRVVAAHQLYAHKVEPLLVRSLDDAFQAMKLVDPQFELLQCDEIGLMESAVFRLLTSVDKTVPPTTYATAARRRLLARLSGLVGSTSLEGASRLRARTTNLITLSDVLNTQLNRVRVTDADVNATCARCQRRLSLDLCRVVAGRETAYSCPSCASLLVAMAPASEDRPTQPEDGYPIGRFRVRPAVDLECRGSKLVRFSRQPVPQ